MLGLSLQEELFCVHFGHHNFFIFTISSLRRPLSFVHVFLIFEIEINNFPGLSPQGKNVLNLGCHFCILGAFFPWSRRLGDTA
jgi:hypothetical protein